VRNKPEEILELVTEQYHRVRNTYTEKDDNKVSALAKKQIDKEMSK
jgi:hypothetical protein